MRLAGAAGTIEDQWVVRRGLAAKNACHSRLDETVLRTGEEFQGRRPPVAVAGQQIAGERLTWQGNCHHAIGHFGSVLANLFKVRSCGDYIRIVGEQGAGSRDGTYGINGNCATDMSYGSHKSDESIPILPAPRPLPLQFPTDLQDPSNGLVDLGPGGCRSDTEAETAGNNVVGQTHRPKGG